MYPFSNVLEAKLLTPLSALPESHTFPTGDTELLIPAILFLSSRHAPNSD